MDIVVELPSHHILNLEMYTMYDKNAEIKSLMYMTSLFSRELYSGEAYYQIKELKQLNFIKKDKVHQSDIPVRHYILMDKDNPKDMILLVFTAK